MEILEDHAIGITTIELRGRLDTTSAPILQVRLVELIESGMHRFVLDLSQVDYVNSLGLRVLLIAAKRLSLVGGSIVLCGVQPTVRENFEAVGFDRLFSMCGTREEASLAVRDGSA